jgi:hypothetical protein
MNKVQKIMNPTGCEDLTDACAKIIDRINRSYGCNFNYSIIAYSIIRIPNVKPVKPIKADTIPKSEPPKTRKVLFPPLAFVNVEVMTVTGPVPLDTPGVGPGVKVPIH